MRRSPIATGVRDGQALSQACIAGLPPKRGSMARGGFNLCCCSEVSPPRSSSQTMLIGGGYACQGRNRSGDARFFPENTPAMHILVNIQQTDSWVRSKAEGHRLNISCRSADNSFRVVLDPSRYLTPTRLGRVM